MYLKKKETCLLLLFTTNREYFTLTVFAGCLFCPADFAFFDPPLGAAAAAG